MIAAMAPRAILVDALGTLLTIENPVPRLVALMGERHAIEVAPAAAATALAAEMSYYREHCIQASDAERLEALRLDCAEILARELGGEVRSLAPAALLQTLLESLRFTPFPEVPATLERWRADGTKVVVASNWDVSLHTVLRDIGLRERLDGVVTSAEVGASKPSGEVFTAALSLAGADPWQAAHVGDSLREDVEGATAAGIEAVWLRRTTQAPASAAPPGVRVIASLDEF
jgi:putative hydrolase of the HAD superfamily